MVNKKISYLGGKLKICEELIRSVGSVLKIKKSQRSIHCNPEDRKEGSASDIGGAQVSVVEMIKEYEARMETMEATYQSKLHRLDKESSKDRETSSTARGSWQGEFNGFESLLLAKDHEIGVLKL